MDPFDPKKRNKVKQPGTTHNDDAVKLPERMQSKLRLYQKRVWKIKIAEGAFAAVFGLLVSYLFVFCLDRFLDTPAMVRGLILIAGSVGMVVLFPVKYHNWVWSHRRLDQVARLLCYKFPRFGDHLLGIVELAQSESHQGNSIALIKAAMRQVDQDFAERDLSGAVPRPGHKRWALAAGIPLILVVVLLLAPFLRAAATNALSRWLFPWGKTERYTFAQLKGGSGTKVVPYAEPFGVEAILQDDSPWVPTRATAQYEKQSPLEAKVDRKGYRFNIPPQTTDGNLSIKVGDAYRNIPVEPKIRPGINELMAEAELPEYLERDETLIEDVRSGTVSLVKGSTAFFKATATRELIEATLNKKPQKVEGTTIITSEIPVEQDAEYELFWKDKHELEPREPQILKVEAREDETPNVTLNDLKNNQVVLSSEVLAFNIRASDDFGVKRVGLEWEGINDPIQNPTPSEGEKIVAGGTPTSEGMDLSATFSASRENVRPQSLRLRSFAEDYMPGRDRAYSAYFVLHVLTPADHFNWLTEQMSKWADASQEVYEEELKLNETNKELMSLPPEALDDPEQKAKIQNQATAEKANAAKLNALIEMGKELVKAAAKNEEFDPEQLEALAEMLKQLEEIAGEKMPSVAELLEQAAEAQGPPAPPPTEPPLPGEPGKSKEPEKPNDSPPEDPIEAPPGGTDLGLEKADKYGPEDLQPEGLDESPEDPNTPGGEVNVDRSEQPEGEPAYLPANPTPLVHDFESGFNKSEKAEDAPQIVGGLLIPTTILEGSGREEEENEPPEATTSELVIQAVSGQQEILDAFAKLASEMNKLLMGFENGTFVKRLKAASRKQIDMAVELNVLDGFGVTKKNIENDPKRKTLSDGQVAASEVVLTIQEDMGAYADRKPSEKLTRVLDEMQSEDVITQVREISESIDSNDIGNSTIASEYWADTLDRWAEQLVDPLPPGTPPPPSLIELPSLSPEMVLEVMRIIDREIKLREETRELHQSIGAVDESIYKERGLGLSTTQGDLAKKSRELADRISAMPNAPDFVDGNLAKEIKKLTDGGKLDEEALVKQVERLENKAKLAKLILGKQIQKLTEAAEVMDEVQGKLEEPSTGPPTIAAIAEVIEILLETARLPNAPMIVKVPPPKASALMLMGLGDDGSKAFIENRSPDQATGKAGRKLPEEFRQGLDAYLSALDRKGN